MTHNDSTLTFSTTVQAPAAQLYDAFTNATYLREWLCNVATTAPREGGHIFLAWNSGYSCRGRFTSLNEGKDVSFTWHGDEPAATEVAVTLEPDGDATKVTLKHAGIGSGPEWEYPVSEFTKGWRTGLENLKSVLETGEDLRFTKRPMLGISVNDFNKEVAEKLGVPVSAGVRLDSVLETMGAAAAGLRGDDVLVSVGGRPVSDWFSLQAALQPLRAGDTVPVEFYRGSEKRTTNMKLSGRPIPSIPGNVPDLVARLEERYARVASDLESFLGEVTDEEAGFRPAPGEWSVKENLAHLIHSEQGWRSYLGDVISGQEPWYDGYGSNVQARISGTTAVYGTLAELVALLKREYQESLAMAANLPESLLARRGSYWRLAYGMLESPFHVYSHLEQMQAAVDAARAAS